MTISEFKAFLEGMDVQGQPTPEQWKRIKEKIDDLAEPLAFAPQPFKMPDTPYYHDTNPGIPPYFQPVTC